MIFFLLFGLVTAFLIWVIQFMFFLKQMNTVSVSVSETLNKIFSSQEISASVSNKISDMKSEILLQFDDFMQNRLIIEMPVLKMFVDDLLIQELKLVFEKELETILPSVILKNMQATLSENSRQEFIKIAWEKIRKKMLKTEIFKLFLFLMIGLISSSIFFLIIAKTA